jgi:hypothetical protein
MVVQHLRDFDNHGTMSGKSERILETQRPGRNAIAFLGRDD